MEVLHGGGISVLQCPQQNAPFEASGRDRSRRTTATNSAVSAVSTVEGKSLSERYERLRQDWATAEWQRMSEDYRSSAGVDEVTGALGPLYFTKVTIEGAPVDGMIDPGSSAKPAFPAVHWKCHMSL